MATLGGTLARVRLPLLTPRLALRAWTPSDVPRLARYINDPAVFRSVTSRHARFTRADEAEFVRGSRRAGAKGQKLNLAITLRETGEVLGAVGLEIRDRDNGRGWTGYWLAPRYWHRGYGSEAASAVCRVAFSVLKLHRIEAAVFEFNPRSMRLLERLGFRREGQRREVLRRGGRWHDEVEFGLLVSEFRPYRAPSRT